MFLLDRSSHLFQYFLLQITKQLTFSYRVKSPANEAHCLLEVGDHLVDVLVDLGELGRELLVFEGVALLVEDPSHGGDQQQPLLGVTLGEADGLA